MIIDNNLDPGKAFDWTFRLLKAIMKSAYIGKNDDLIEF